MNNVIPSNTENNTKKLNLRDENDILINSDKEMANHMNIYFTSIGPKLSKDLIEPWTYAGV